MEKPFYISQLPEKTQAWIKEKTKENFLKDGMSEEEAEQKATDFLDEKVNVAEDFFGKDFYKSLDPAEDKLDHEVVNDFAIDAIKDNFTPPGAKEEEPFTDEEYDELYTGVIEGEDPDFFKKYREDFPKDFDKDGFPNLENASKDYVKNWVKGQKERHQGWREWLDEDKDGKIEKDEMADFQKSLDDYAAKNKKGRDDIPVTTRR